MKRLSIDPQIQSVQSRYRDQVIELMSIQYKNSQTKMLAS